jgi:type VI secretion system protein
MNKNQKINAATFSMLQKPVFALARLPVYIFCLMLTSCSGMSPDPDLSVSSVKLVVDQDANDNSATAVDLVVIYKKELLEALQKMKARDYFKASEQIQRDYPGMIKIYRWEVVPGQIIGPQPLSLCSFNFITPCPIGGIVFANYERPGEHRIRLGSIDDIQIHLANTQFFIGPAE